jgi:hypothetical protein
MKELILTWNSGTATRTIRSTQPGIPSHRFRIGRDPVTCDLVLPSVTQEDLTVSKLHVEIYFDPTSDTFYLRNLKGENNPPQLYGQRVYEAPVPIDKNGILQLGKRELQLAIVTFQEAPATIPPKLQEEFPKPMACPQCSAGYTYEEAAKLNGRCPKDGFLLHGASIYIPQNP